MLKSHGTDTNNSLLIVKLYFILTSYNFLSLIFVSYVVNVCNAFVLQCSAAYRFSTLSDRYLSRLQKFASDTLYYTMNTDHESRHLCTLHTGQV